MIQISTDFVFSGKSNTPYLPDSEVEPIGVYGASKVVGEMAVRNILGEKRAYIIRTSWLYGPEGKNFLLTMLGLHKKMSSLNQPLKVVADQIGSPTNTYGLANTCWKLITKSIQNPSLDIPMFMHWSDSGVASWYDFAMAIGEIAVEENLLKESSLVLPIKTIDYPTPAKRPNYSVLDCFVTKEILNLRQEHWRSSLRSIIRRLVNHTIER